MVKKYSALCELNKYIAVFKRHIHSQFDYFPEACKAWLLLYVPAGLRLKNSTSSPPTRFMWLVWISE